MVSSSREEYFDAESVAIGFEEGGSLVLLSGRAQIYRDALLSNIRYTFHRTAAVVVDVATSATIQVVGATSILRRPFDGFLDELHCFLDAARVEAKLAIADRNKGSRTSATAGPSTASGDREALEKWQGPRVMVVGGAARDRQLLCRSLLNLAVGGGEFGVSYLDVDLETPSLTTAGSVAAVFVEEPVGSLENFNAVMPLSFFHGDRAVNSRTRKRYLDLCACAAQAATALGFSNPKFEAGGFLVNTMSPTTELKHDILVELLSIFSVTHVIIADSDTQLEKVLLNAVLGRTIAVLQAPKLSLLPSFGSVKERQQSVDQTLQYFFGTSRTPLQPVRGVARTSEITFLQVEAELTVINWSDIPDCSIAAVVWADTIETAAEANVAGYVVLLEVGRYFFSFLSPSGGNLPKPFLLVSPTLQLPKHLVMPLYLMESSS